MGEKKLRVLVVGLGNMGMSHALAYTRIPGFEVVGVCERRIAERKLPVLPLPILMICHRKKTG